MLVVRAAAYAARVLIGVDTSGKFLTGKAYEPTAVAAATATEETFSEIGEWAGAALQRWGIADKHSELHAKKLRAEEKREICEMLAARDDVRLTAVLTDTLLLRSPEALAFHRERQVRNAREGRPSTPEGKAREEAIIALLEDPALSDGEYALAAILPLVTTAAVQQALCFSSTARR